jgi:hypothetical protein
MAFEASAAALGNLMFGQSCQETSGRPAFLVGLAWAAREAQTCFIAGSRNSARSTWAKCVFRWNVITDSGGR